MFQRTAYVSIAILSLLSFSRVASAEGGPPLLTDDPWTPGDKHWEINLAVTSEVNHDEFRFEAPIADINYGVGEHIQLKYEVPFTVSGGTAQTTQSGLAQSIAGVKWRYLDKERVGVAMSTYPQVSFRTVGGFRPASSDSDANESGTEFLLPIELEEGSGVFKFNQELGYHIVQGTNAHYAYGGGLTYSLRDGFLLLGEIHGESSTSLSESNWVSNFGTVYDLSGHLSLLISVGRTLINSDDSAAKYLSYTGMQLRL